MVTDQSADVAEEISRRMRIRGLTAAGTAGALALAFSAFAYAGLVKPIRQLLVAQRELMGADSAVAETGGGNELLALRQSFEVLKSRLREKASVEDVVIGRYQVRKKIGEGAMGTVLLAWDSKLEREVALKTIKLSEDLPDIKREELVRTLLKEARVIAGVSHQNIVAVYDVEDSPEAPYVAMDSPGVPGRTLAGLLSDEGAVTIVDFMYTRCITICAALGGQNRDFVFGQFRTGVGLQVFLRTSH